MTASIVSADQPSSRPAVTSPEYRGVFPNSTKVYLEGPRGVRVPMRQIGLSGGEPPLRVYDTSGPEGFDVREGLPPLRAAWIAARDVAMVPAAQRSGRPAVPGTLDRPVLRGRSSLTQLSYARKGEITPEMEFIAIREGLPP